MWVRWADVLQSVVYCVRYSLSDGVITVLVQPVVTG